MGELQKVPMTFEKTLLLNVVKFQWSREGSVQFLLVQQKSSELSSPESEESRADPVLTDHFSFFFICTVLHSFIHSLNKSLEICCTPRHLP